MSKSSDKLTLALTTTLLIAEASTKNTLLALDLVLYIHYLFWFKNNKIWALIYSNNKINVMTLIYIAKLGLKVYYNNIGAQKIDNSILWTFEMIFAKFKIENK